MRAWKSRYLLQLCVAAMVKPIRGDQHTFLDLQALRKLRM